MTTNVRNKFSAITAGCIYDSEIRNNHVWLVLTENTFMIKNVKCSYKTKVLH